MKYNPEIEFLLSEHVQSIGSFCASEKVLIEKRRKKEQQRLELWKKTEKVTYLGCEFADEKASARNSMSKSVLMGVSEHQGILTECGRFLEVWLSEKPVVLGMCTDRQGVGISLPETAENIASRVNHRARKQIRRLVNANDLRGLLTLTLAPPSEENDKKYKTVDIERQKDYSEVRKILHRYQCRLRKRIRANTNKMRLLRRSIGGCNPRYIAVFELHDSEKTSELKRGTWHIHLAVDCNEVLVSLMRRTWKHGMTDFQDYRYDKEGKLRDEEVSNPGAYISEYIGKEGAQFGEAELRYKKRYTASRGVKRPKKVMISGGEIEGEIEQITYNGSKYRNTYYRLSAIPGTALFGVVAYYEEIKK